MHEPLHRILHSTFPTPLFYTQMHCIFEVLYLTQFLMDSLKSWIVHPPMFNLNVWYIIHPEHHRMPWYCEFKFWDPYISLWDQSQLYKVDFGSHQYPVEFSCIIVPDNTNKFLFGQCTTAPCKQAKNTCKTKLNYKKIKPESGNSHKWQCSPHPQIPTYPLPDNSGNRQIKAKMHGANTSKTLATAPPVLKSYHPAQGQSKM